MIQAVFKRTYCWKRLQFSNVQNAKLNEESKMFLRAFPKVIDVARMDMTGRSLPQFTKRFEELLEYTVLKEHRFRPPILLEAYKALELPRNLTKERWELVIMFAWCLEIVQTSMIVHDDTWDQQKMRWNEVCWNNRPNVGLIAINDGTLLYEFSFSILKKYFSNLPEYLSLMELLHEMNLFTSIGQSMSLDSRYGTPVYESFTMESFRNIAYRKGGSAIVAAPFIGALVLSRNLHMLRFVWDIILEIGVAFQYDNDILDVYEINGTIKESIGNDIRDGELTWMAAKVIESGNQDAIEIFKRNYGRSDAECVRTIVEIYDRFKMFDQYLEYRLNTKNMIDDRGANLPSTLTNAILATVNNVIPKLLDD